MEHEQESAGTGVTRGQNQLHLLPEDWSAAFAVIEPFLDRIDVAGLTGPQLLVVTNDGEAAAGIAARLASTSRSNVRVLAATDARRAARVQRTAPAHVVLGPPHVLVELLQSAALKLESVRFGVLAWTDDLDPKSLQALETLMAEVPKDAPRVVIASALTPEVEQLAERYARRARRMHSVSPEAQAPVSLSYVTVIDAGRLPMLRRILDATDPESATIVVRTLDSRTAIEAMLRSLGYWGDAGGVRVSEQAEGNSDLLIIYDLPSSEDDVRRIVRSAGNARVVALVAPRQLSALRRLAGGAISPFALPAAAARARTREERLRDELRATLETGQYSRELLALEPLLGEYDGAEIAAAALRMLETERTKAASRPTESAPPAMTRLYVNVGEMDNVRPGDLVGAITNETGISRAELGRVDVRERHSTVEVATPVANTVVSKLTGVSIKGRRALVKVDEGPGGGGEGRGGGRERRERPARPRQHRR